VGDIGRGSVSAGVRKLDGVADGHSGVSSSVCGWSAAFGRPPRWVSGRTPPRAHLHERAVACDSGVSGAALGPQCTSCISAVAAAKPPVSMLVAGADEATGYLSGHQSAVDTSMATDTSSATCAAHRPSGRRSFRTQRTVNPLTGLTR
jgi:hypothetical protein